MSSVQDFIRAADQFLAAPKELVGATTPQTWHDGREIGDGGKTLRFPLELAGEQRQGTGLIITAFPEASSLTFHLILVFHWGIYRLDFDPDVVHSNFPLVAPDGKVPLVVYGPHYHPWSRNKGYVRDIRSPFRLPIALSLDPHIRQFDAALRWFCDEVNINLRDHAIQLPPRERLL